MDVSIGAGESGPFEWKDASPAAPALFKRRPTKVGFGEAFEKWLMESYSADDVPSWMAVYLRKWIMHASCNTQKKRRGFDITYDYLRDMAIAQNFRCAISGIEFIEPPYRKGHKCREPFAPSVDRIDCAKGYLIGNVRLLCVVVNIARCDFPDAILIEMSKSIAKNNL